jgi:hypothetical protein
MSKDGELRNLYRRRLTNVNEEKRKKGNRIGKATQRS